MEALGSTVSAGGTGDCEADPGQCPGWKGLSRVETQETWLAKKGGYTFAGKLGYNIYQQMGYWFKKKPINCSMIETWLVNWGQFYGHLSTKLVFSSGFFLVIPCGSSRGWMINTSMGKFTQSLGIFGYQLLSSFDRLIMFDQQSEAFGNQTRDYGRKFPEFSLIPPFWPWWVTSFCWSAAGFRFVMGQWVYQPSSKSWSSHFNGPFTARKSQDVYSIFFA